MYDILLAIIIQLGIATTIGIWVSRRIPQWGVIRQALAVTIGIGIAAIYPTLLYDNMALVRLVPNSAMIIFQNTMPIGIAVFAAFTWHNLAHWRRRRVLYIASLAMISVFSLLLPIRSQPLAENSKGLWLGEVCMQSTDYTCSAAAAATLLRRHGIPVTEAEMTRHCFTTAIGTSTLGLYHGLSTVGAWRDLRVDTSIQTLPQLTAALREGPVLISVCLPDSPSISERYARESGWDRGLSHAVVVEGYTEHGMIRVMDPSRGLEYWRPRDLSILFHGEAMRLLPKDAK